MDKQFRLFSVDTKAFYTEKERELNTSKFGIRKKIEIIEQWAIHIDIHKKQEISLNDYKIKLNKFEELKSKKECVSPQDEVELKELRKFFKAPKQKKIKSKEYKTAQEIKLEKTIKEENYKKEVKNGIKERLDSIEEYIELKNELKEFDKQLKEEMKNNDIRQLNPKTLTPYNQITLFENSLSRAMNINADELIMDLIIVRAYHYDVLKQLIVNGFEYVDEDGVVNAYKVFTASAGQIRTKKVIFIKKEKWEEYEKTLMCGLTIQDINDSKECGCNINKFLAYLALCNSATDELEGFDIDKSIVIDDFETMVKGTVDYIDNKTFELTRKDMEVLIPHSDGCGWVLPSVNKKNFMIRLPWVKGLVTPCDYISFCDEYNKGDYKIKDIYGKEWDLKNDNIEYVFTKSQFKMCKYYSSWEDYKYSFKKYKCMANYCNLEPNTKEFRKASLNYQMWQTLTDITDEEIAEFTDTVDEYITKGYSDRKTMLKILGADKDNLNKTNLQKCIEIYPELIRDYHVKEELASTLNARKKEAKYGKFKINGTYTFLIPDVFAWMENVFLGHKVPMGLLRNNEVSCSLYKESNELIVNRSPHLYREWAVRDNINNQDTKKWFITNGVYTSSHDLISKILQFDVDGDKALVIADDKLCNIAKRNMKDIVPLYYEMGKAKAQIINEEHIYKSLTKAFSFNNIGKFSNKLTVMWNLDEIDLTTIAQITALNNFTIDGAKTLLVPKVPKDVEEKMKASNGKLPYFFQFAKDKDTSEVAEINNSTMNRICKNIENIKQCNYDFSSIGKFNKNTLMRNSKIEINNDIINKYKELEKRKNDYYTKYNKLEIENTTDSKFNFYKEVRKEFINYCSELGFDTVSAIDMVIRYIYTTNRSSKKGFLFDVFGDVVYNNIILKIDKPLGEYIMCEVCGERVKLNGTSDTSRKYCDRCARIVKLENDRKIQKERYNSRKAIVW